MRKIALFAAAVAVFVVIGFDTWLSVRTITPGALAGSTFNRLITVEKGSPISNYDDYLFVPHSGESETSPHSPQSAVPHLASVANVCKLTKMDRGIF